MFAGPARPVALRLRRAALAAALALAVAGVAAWQPARLATQAGERGVQAPVQALLALVQELQAAPAEQRAREVNRFFNQRVRWREDAQVWGQADYWATPLQMFEKGAGDCEDLAIAKYFTLLALGLPPASLRLVYVRAQWQGRAMAHMVLAWTPEGQTQPLILDNLDPLVRPGSERPDLQPIFSFNAEGLWQGGQPAGSPLARLTIWRDLLDRARAEGFFSSPE